jgi:hypothetical protein
MCIIASIPTPKGHVLFKNRDRNYKPQIRIVHVELEGVQAIVLLDEITEWVEGMNEGGIAIVNSALMVQRDEAEKKKSKKGKKSEDGVRILKALHYLEIDDVIQSLLDYKGGIKGHTLVASPTELYSIESTSNHQPFVKKLDPSKLYVRTNHGLKHEDAGYTKGEDRKSSILRYQYAKESFQNVEEPIEVFKTLSIPKHEKDSPYNPVRDTKNMFTSSQIVFNPKEKSTFLHVLPDKVVSFKTTDLRKKSLEGLLPFHHVKL